LSSDKIESKDIEAAPEDLEHTDKSAEYKECLLNISKINALEKVRTIKSN
jgi:hypothetical protein